VKKIHDILKHYDTRCLMFINITTDLRSVIRHRILRDGTDIIWDNIHSHIEIQINADELDRNSTNVKY